MLKTIPVEQVVIGMYIHELKGSWIDHPFWKKQFLLNDQLDLNKLLNSPIKAVVIDVDKGLDVIADDSVELSTHPEFADLQPSNTQPSSVTATLHKLVSYEVERAQAKKTIETSRQVVASIFSDIRLGKGIQQHVVKEVVDEITASVSRNTQALISLVRLKTLDNCTYMHSVAVCALMTALAKELGLTATEVKQAGYAGLLHDMGKALVPAAILNKPDSLTEAEFEIVRQHCEQGHVLLKQANIEDAVALDVCLHHHEKYDGTGYPHALAQEAISLYARMGAVCDVYDAVTSVRPYKSPWEPGIALKKMASWQGHFDPQVFNAFVKCLGIYPIGSLVMLKSGRLGVVTRQTHGSLLKPVVKVFFSTQANTYIPEQEIDLSVPGFDAIVSVETNEKWHLPSYEHLWAA